MIALPAPWFVAVGASGGDGLQDIKALLDALPRPLCAVVLVVLHRPWDKVSHLRSVLARGSRHPVVIADEGESFRTGTVYIGEPDQHLTLAETWLGKIVDDPARQHRNRTIDLLFQSLADHGGRRIIGVVLSGSLDDGSRGLAAIHHAGGVTLVLRPTALTRPGMQENAIAYDGPIDLIADPSGIAAEITRRIEA